MPRPHVSEDLSTAAGQQVRGLSMQGLANTLRAIGKTDTQMPGACESLCTAAAREVQASNMQDVADALWAIVKTSMRRPDALEDPLWSCSI